MDQPLHSSITDETVVAEGHAFNAVRLTIRNPDGSEHTKPAVRHRGAVVIVPVLEQPGRTPRIVFVRNERVIVGHRLLECPAGGLEPGESPAETAERELAEEAGYHATSLHPLGWFYTSPGMSDERMHAFVATGLMHVGQSLEPYESMTVERLATGAALDAIDRGEINDAKTVVAILKALRAGYLGQH